MIINSKKRFKDQIPFTLGEKVVPRGEGFVKIKDADFVEEEEFVYLSYSHLKKYFDGFLQFLQDKSFYAHTEGIITPPCGGKTTYILNRIKDTIKRNISGYSMVESLINFFSEKFAGKSIYECNFLAIITSYTKSPIENLPDIIKKMNCLSKNFIEYLNEIPMDWITYYARNNTNDWIKFLWGRAKYLYEEVDHRTFPNFLEYKAFLMPVVIGTVWSLKDNSFIRNTDKNIYLFVEEGGMVPALITHEMVMKAKRVFVSATQELRLKDTFLPVELQKTLIEMVPPENIITQYGYYSSYEPQCIKIEKQEISSFIENCLTNYNTIAVVSNNGLNIRSVIKKTVHTISSGPMYDVVIYQGKIRTTEDQAHRLIAKSKARCLFVEIVN